MSYITQEQAHEMGAKGAPATEAERLLFEAWMKGHCWEVEGKWSGRTYIGERVYDGSMITRMLWAVWRDRAALAQPAKPEQPEQAECGNTPYDEGPFTIAQPAKPVEFQGYAGVSMWLGKHRITQLLTETEIQHEFEGGASLTRKAQYCLDGLAAAAKERT